MAARADAVGQRDALGRRVPGGLRAVGVRADVAFLASAACEQGQKDHTQRHDSRNSFLQSPCPLFTIVDIVGRLRKTASDSLASRVRFRPWLALRRSRGLVTTRGSTMSAT